MAGQLWWRTVGGGGRPGQSTGPHPLLQLQKHPFVSPGRFATHTNLQHDGKRETRPCSRFLRMFPAALAQCQPLGSSGPPAQRPPNQAHSTPNLSPPAIPTWDGSSLTDGPHPSREPPWAPPQLAPGSVHSTSLIPLSPCPQPCPGPCPITCL